MKSCHCKTERRAERGTEFEVGLVYKVSSSQTELLSETLSQKNQNNSSNNNEIKFLKTEDFLVKIVHLQMSS